MMTGAEFSGDVCKALDAYVVPPLPTGFSDRLMARVEAGNGSAVARKTGLANRLRRYGRSNSNMWRRSGRILGSVAFLSLATATAAAAGFFGNPVYVPGVSEMLDKAELVVSPLKAAPARPVVFAAQPQSGSATAIPLILATGKDRVVNRITDLRNDQQFENLTPRQRLRVARKQVRDMIRTGQATPQEARAAVRDLVRNADPETKAQWKETAKARRAARLERAGRIDAGTALSAISEDGLPVVISDEPTTDIVVTDDLPTIANSDLSPEQVETLRNRYRSATPGQRAQIRRILREHRGN